MRHALRKRRRRRLGHARRRLPASAFPRVSCCIYVAIGQGSTDSIIARQAGWRVIGCYQGRRVRWTQLPRRAQRVCRRPHHGWEGSPPGRGGGESETPATTVLWRGWLLPRGGLASCLGLGVLCLPSSEAPTAAGLAWLAGRARTSCAGGFSGLRCTRHDRAPAVWRAAPPGQGARGGRLWCRCPCRPQHPYSNKDSGARWRREPGAQPRPRRRTPQRPCQQRGAGGRTGAASPGAAAAPSGSRRQAEGRGPAAGGEPATTSQQGPPTGGQRGRPRALKGERPPGRGASRRPRGRGPSRARARWVGGWPAGFGAQGAGLATPNLPSSMLIHHVIGDT